MRLSPHFMLEEFTSTAHTGIDNIPNGAIVGNLRELCGRVLEPLRQHFDKPLVITSGYRSPELNRAVNGVSNSQHMVGEAADIIIPGVELDDILEWLRRHGDFDQAYKGPSFVHVSYRRGNRGQVFTR